MRFDYWQGPWNHSDLFYIAAQIINFLVHINNTNHSDIVSVIMIVIVLFMTTHKVMFYLQNVESVSILVNLVTQVIYDLRLFMIFFFVLVYMFALVVGTLGVGNLMLKGQGAIASKGKGSRKKIVNLDNYYYIQQFFGNIIDMFRYSIGDIDIGRAAIVNREVNMVYWFVYLLLVFMLTIIFLNFIIAEASASYNKV